MSTGWIRGRFEGTYSGELTSAREGARRYSIELQSGAVHDAQWVQAPGDEVLDGPEPYRHARLSHVRFAPPGEPERVGTLYDVRVEVLRLRRAHEQGNRSFGRLEGTIVARTAVERPAPKPEPALEAGRAAMPAAPPASAGAPAAATPPDAQPVAPPAEPAPAQPLRPEPLRPFVQPIRRSFATPIEPVPQGFHPAIAIAILVLGWCGVSLWLMCGPQAAATWATPLAAGALLRRFTRAPRRRFGEALGWLGLFLVSAQLMLLVGPAEQAFRAGCLPPFGARIPLLAGLVLATSLLCRAGPIATAVVCWTLLSFGVCDHAAGTCGPDRAKRLAERRWPKDPERVAASVEAEPLSPSEPVPPSPAPSAPRAVESPKTTAPMPVTPPSERAPTPASTAGAPAVDESPPTAREPPDPAAPLSMEQANRRPGLFFASRGKRSVVFPTEPIFGPGGAEVSQGGTIELSRLAALLKLQGKRRVRIELHAAAAGDSAAEQALTERQARAVEIWLERTGGSDRSRLEIVGLGSRRPLIQLPADSDLPQDDRRMELHVLDTAPTAPASPRAR